MKFFELANDLSSRPDVFVDMDGVLADMFGAVAKHHGVGHWRKARKKHDRVDQLVKDPGFFLNLDPLPNAHALINGVHRLAGEFSILSSPAMSSVEQSSQEKAQWLKKHLTTFQPRSVLFDHEKFKYARQADGTPNILIDDWETNICLWEANGGVGILYKDSRCSQALQQLQSALSGEFKRTCKIPRRVLKKERVSEDSHIDFDQKLWTNKEVLDYVNGIHSDYTLDAPILKHKTWKLTAIPVSKLSSPEYYDQDDPYRRVIDLDWAHIADISPSDIRSKPVVANRQGWVIDGNHRVTAARAKQITKIPAFVPYRD